MRNPIENFRPDLETEEEIWAWERSKAFYIRTVTFDLTNTEFADLEANNWPEAEVAQWENTMIQLLESNNYADLNDNYFKGIDEYPYNDIIPLLKCEEPCFTCLDNDPKYCLSCWGRDTDIGSGTFSKYFLQPPTVENGLRATCASQCDGGYTTNGNIAEATEEEIAADTIDWSKAYYECEACDIPCKTCEGAGPYSLVEAENLVGVAGDKFKCTSCDPAFKYLSEETLECYPACLSGMYTISETDPTEEMPDGDYRCGFCEEPCSTCRKCFPPDTPIEDRTFTIGGN